MDRGVRLGGFELDQQAALHKDVGSKGILDENATVLDRDRQLAFVVHAASFQFRAEQKFVRRFQKPGPEGPMKLIAAIDHDPSKLFKAAWIEISWLRGFVRTQIVHWT
jgi:hypothetical protein